MTTKLLKSAPLIIALLSVTSVYAEKDHDILLRGILDLGSSQAFSISNESGSESHWLKIGQSYNGYLLKDFDAETQSLTVEFGEETFEISLAGASEHNESGTADKRFAEAQRMMNLMNFEKMMDDSMKAQLGSMSDMMRQQMAQQGLGQDEELIEFQTKAMMEMFDDIDWESMRGDMAEAYANLFTNDELEGMSNFYTSPAGQASMEKMPRLQAKMTEVMMPEILKASQDFKAKIVKFIQEREENPTD